MDIHISMRNGKGSRQREVQMETGGGGLDRSDAYAFEPRQTSRGQVSIQHIRLSN